jgi:hypothetical protein
MTGGQSVARPVQVTLIARCGRGLGLLALLLAIAGCAGAGGGGGSGGGGGGQCNDGSWCGDRLDQDHDNSISQGEWDSAFQAADTNGDGQLSQGEFQGAGGNWGGGRGGGR